MGALKTLEGIECPQFVFEQGFYQVQHFIVRLGTSHPLPPQDTLSDLLPPAGSVGRMP